MGEFSIWYSKYTVLLALIGFKKPGFACPTNRNLVARVFTRFSSVTCICFISSLVHYFVCVYRDWQLYAFVLVFETLTCILIPLSFFFCRRSFVKRTIRHYPKVQEMLQYASECAVCGQSFLNTWLECVHFVDARKVRYKFKFIFVLQRL